VSSKTREEPLKEVIIYTDGAAEPNPGPGGYGAVLRCGTHCKERVGGLKKTTSNRMELLAAIVSLEALTVRCTVKLNSDLLRLEPSF
jgi:ribonuclease HI